MKAIYIMLNEKLLFLLVAFSIATHSLWGNDFIFRIGEPDSTADGFKSFGKFEDLRYVPKDTNNIYESSHQFFSKQTVFNVGKDKDSDFPYTYPLCKCIWAGNKNQSVRINFTLQEIPNEDLYFKLGFADTSTKEVAIFVKINDSEFEKQKIAYANSPERFPSFGNIIYHPETWALPAVQIFKIKKESLNVGENFIELKAQCEHMYDNFLHIPHWFAYDYLELSTSPDLPTQPNHTKELKADILESLDFDEVIFTTRDELDFDPHWYANVGFRAQIKSGDEEVDKKMGIAMYSRGSGKLVRYNLKTNEYKILLNDPLGAIRNPCLSYDAKKILFSYRPAGSHHYNLYEIDIDGNNLTKLPIGGEWDDYECAYLPNDDIVYISTRCFRMVPCWATDVGTLHRYFREENVVRPLSSNLDQDNSPSISSDGRIFYTRWDYTQRSEVLFHGLWKRNPDGSNDSVYFGNEIPNHLFIDAFQLQDTDTTVFTYSLNHGARQHSGYIARLNSPKNPNDFKSLEFLTGDIAPEFFTPYPLNDNYTIAASLNALVLLDRKGHIVPIVMPHEIMQKGPTEHFGVRVFEPRPIRPRAKEPILADKAEWDSDEATVLLMDAAIGRNMEDVKQGDIKKIMILEVEPMANRASSGPEPVTMGGTFTIEKILGTVNVEDDGSANFSVPAGKALSFVALDKDDRAVKRMQSILDFRSGTVTSCIGCHEQRDMAPPKTKTILKALQRPTEKITPIPEITALNRNNLIDYLYDIQPIWDKYCLKCHNADDMCGGLDLSSDMRPMFIGSYYNLRIHRQINDGLLGLGNMPPYAFGSGSSPILNKLDGTHNDIKITPEERRLVMAWLDIGGVQISTYAGLETGDLTNNLTFIVDYAPDKNWPEVAELKEVIKNNCVECHTGIMRLSDAFTHDKSEVPNRAFLRDVRNPKDPRNRVYFNSIYNLTNPEKSTILTSPLAKNAGGKADDSDENKHKVIFKDKSDIRYQTILKAIQRAKKYLYEENPRYNMPNFKYAYSYLYYLKRAGVIKDGEESKYTPWQLDQLYWDNVTGPKEYPANQNSTN